MTRNAIRLENVTALIKVGFGNNQAAFARASEKNPTLVNRWLKGKNIGGDAARDIEETLELPEFVLDQQHDNAEEYFRTLLAPRLAGVNVMRVPPFADTAVPPRSSEPPDWPPAVAEDQAPPYIVQPSEGVPVVGTAQLGDNGYYDELGFPPGQGDGAVTFPSTDPNAYALRVRGDSMRPRIRPGEYVIVEPNSPTVAGDEVVVKTVNGRSMVKILGSRRDGLVELRSVNEDHPPLTLEETQVAAIHLVAGIARSNLFRQG